jgi:hypothetical protein
MAAHSTDYGIPSLREALRRARDLGAEVKDCRRTGEVRVRFAGIGAVKHNARRKDASRALCLLLRRAQAKAST